jgi:hypothetical protein
MFIFLEPVVIQTYFSPAGRFPGGVGQLFSDIIKIFIIISAVGAIIFIILGGLKMVTASGDPKKLAGARNTIFYALIGLVVIALAFAIVQVVQYMLGSQIAIT